VDLLLGSDVDATRRLVEQEHGRRLRQPLAQCDLLLVAAAQLRDLLPEIAGFDREQAGQRSGERTGRRRTDSTPCAQVRERAGDQVVLDRCRQGDALDPPLLGDETETLAQCRVVRGDFRELVASPCDEHPARHDGIKSRHQAQELRAACADQSPDAHDLASANLQRDVVDAVGRDVLAEHGDGALGNDALHPRQV
jgi:hypothetical protein